MRSYQKLKAGSHCREAIATGIASGDSDNLEFSAG